jgi:DNA-directed RNA polymerase subunit RPC12/RpoP
MLSRRICQVWGHAVHNDAFLKRGRACTRCRQTLLGDNATVVRIGHTLSCFVRHHTYEEVARRDRHTEYACVRCGHPLLFRSDCDPYAGGGVFRKKVRYLCGLFGHRVHAVTERHGGTEYACHCGHTFIQQPRRRDVVRHPLGCVLLGHWVSFVERRGAWSEYACRTCGHPFLFKGRANPKARSPEPSVDDSRPNVDPNPDVANPALGFGIWALGFDRAAPRHAKARCSSAPPRR